MSLLLIGTGIAFDLTLSAIEELKHCDKIYWEGYTGVIPEEKIQQLAKQLNKEIIELKRSQTESSFLVNEAKKAKIGLLTSGDPLTATTHITLVIDAKKANLDVQIIPNSSIYAVAPGKAGLQIYKFGRTVTLVNPRPNYQPKSALEAIKENLSQNLHTLILLDTEPEPMEAKKALEILEAAGFTEKIVVLSQLGSKEEKIAYGNIDALKKHNLGKPPFCLILPGKLHDLEEEYLELFRI